MASVLWSRSAMNSISSPKRRTSCPLSFSAAPRIPKSLADAVENPRRGAPDRLDAVVVGSDAVDEIQRVGRLLAVQI